MSLRRRAGFPGHALHVGRGFFGGDDIGVLGLDVEQVGLVRLLRPVADALARDERRITVLEEVYRRRPDAAARRRAAHDDRVDVLRDEDRGEVRAEEGRGALFEDYGLFLPASEPRVYLDPFAPDLQLGKAGSLLEPERPVFQVLLEADGGEDDWNLSLTGHVEEAPRRFDLFCEVGSHGALGIGEAAAEIDHEDGWTGAERHALPEAGALVDLSSFVAHRITPRLAVVARNHRGAPRRSGRASRTCRRRASRRACRPRL